MSTRFTYDDAMKAAKRNEVDKFLATLSPWDLLYLRDELRSGRVKIEGLAGLSNLPAEILCAISTHLSLEDIFNCHLVCRDWREAWGQGAVVAGICHYFFTGLLELHDARDQPQLARELFQSAARYALRRRRGQPALSSFIFWDESWSSQVFVNPRDLSDGNRGSFRGRVAYYSDGPPVFYSSGMLAWQPDRGCVIVDNLRSCERHVCLLTHMLMAGQLVSLQAVSGKLLVFVTTSGEMGGSDYSIVHIGHVESGNWSRVSLPGPFARCFVEDERAVFLTRQGLAISWSYGGSSFELDVSGDLNRPPEGYEMGWSLPGVIIHPTREEIQFVAHLCRKMLPDTDRSLNTTKEQGFVMVVVRYDHGKPVRRYQEQIHDSSLSRAEPYRPVGEHFSIALLCNKMSSSGLYNLGTCLQARRSFEDPQVVEIATAGFNIYTETFVQREKVDTISGDGSVLARKGHFDPSTWRLSLDLWPLSTWAESCASTSWWFYPTTFAKTHGKGNGRTKGAYGVAEYLKEINKCVPSAEACRVFGDDDFQIFVTTQGVLVWAFTDDTKLPSTSDPAAVAAGMEYSELIDPVRSFDLRPLAG